MGRNVDLHELITFVLNDKINKIYLVGQHGIGKTRLSHELARFLTDRQIFSDGVHYLDFEKTKN